MVGEGERERWQWWVIVIVVALVIAFIDVVAALVFLGGAIWLVIFLFSIPRRQREKRAEQMRLEKEVAWAQRVRNAESKYGTPLYELKNASEAPDDRSEWDSEFHNIFEMAKERLQKEKALKAELERKQAGQEVEARKTKAEVTRKRQEAKKLVTVLLDGPGLSDARQLIRGFSHQYLGGPEHQDKGLQSQLQAADVGQIEAMVRGLPDKQLTMLQQALARSGFTVQREILEFVVALALDRMRRQRFHERINRFKGDDPVEFMLEVWNRYRKLTLWQEQELKLIIERWPGQSTSWDQVVSKARAERELHVFSTRLRSKALIEDGGFSVVRFSGDGLAFEKWLYDAFASRSYDTEMTSITGDQGADLIVESLRGKAVIQAKAYTGSVGNTAVQEVVSARNHHGADFAVVATTGTFTPGAKALATSNRVILLEASDIDEWWHNNVDIGF